MAKDIQNLRSMLSTALEKNAEYLLLRVEAPPRIRTEEGTESLADQDEVTEEAVRTLFAILVPDALEHLAQDIPARSEISLKQHGSHTVFCKGGALPWIKVFLHSEKEDIEAEWLTLENAVAPTRKAEHETDAQTTSEASTQDDAEEPSPDDSETLPAVDQTRVSSADHESVRISELETRFDTKSASMRTSLTELARDVNGVDPLLDQLRNIDGGQKLHLSHGDYVFARTRQGMIQLSDERLSQYMLNEWLIPIIPLENRQQFEAEGSTAFHYDIPSGQRYRVHVQENFTGMSATFSPVDNLSQEEELDAIPENLADVLTCSPGLILVVTPNQTLGAKTMQRLLHIIGQQGPLNIVSLEHPISEQVEVPGSLFQQREFDPSLKNIAQRVGRVCHEQPDIVNLRGLRMEQVLLSSLELCATESMVLCHYSARSPWDALERLILQFPESRRGYGRHLFAELLKGMVFCTEAQMEDKTTRPLYEVVRNSQELNDAVRQGQVRDLARTLTQLNTGHHLLLNHQLATFINDGTLTRDYAESLSYDKAALIEYLKKSVISAKKIG